MSISQSRYSGRSNRIGKYTDRMTNAERARASQMSQQWGPSGRRARLEREARGGVRPRIPNSCVVKELAYFENQHKVHVRLNQKWYTYTGVPHHVFLGWKEGNAMAMTNDPTGARRWWIFKLPSLGAFYNQIIKGRYECTEGRN